MVALDTVALAEFKEYLEKPSKETNKTSATAQQSYQDAEQDPQVAICTWSCLLLSLESVDSIQLFHRVFKNFSQEDFAELLESRSFDSDVRRHIT